MVTRELATDHAENKKWEAAWVKDHFRRPQMNPNMVIVDSGIDRGAIAPVDPNFRVPDEAWQFQHISAAEVKAIDNTRRVKREQEETFFANSLKLAKIMRGNYINVEKRAGKNLTEVVEQKAQKDNEQWRSELLKERQQQFIQSHDGSVGFWVREDVEYAINKNDGNIVHLDPVVMPLVNTLDGPDVEDHDMDEQFSDDAVHGSAWNEELQHHMDEVQGHS